MLSPTVLPRMFCLPHAGGSAVMYHKWRARYADRARVTPVDLPGHGSRRAEPLIDDVQELTTRLAKELAESADGPYVVFGHSFGALVAFELAHRLNEAGAGPPQALVVSGRNGPSRPHPVPPLHDAPADVVWRGLRTLQGTLPAVQQHPDLLDLFLPPLRADLRMVETYQRPPLPRLSCPVWALAGDVDPLVDDTGLAAWQDETDGTCRTKRVPGGHMVLDDPALHRALDAAFSVGVP